MIIKENVFFEKNKKGKSEKKVEVLCELCNEKRFCRWNDACNSYDKTNKNICKKCMCVSKNNPRAGVALSQETKNKISNSLTGRKLSQEEKERLSKAWSGEKNPKYNAILPPEEIERRRLHAKSYIGDKNPNWKSPEERLTALHEQIRHTIDYKQWRASCFKRDGYACQNCKQVGGILQVDHIVPMAVIIYEEKITTKEQAQNCLRLWEMTNGRTLCIKCHRNTETFGNKTYKLILHLKGDNR